MTFLTWITIKCPVCNGDTTATKLLSYNSNTPKWFIDDRYQCCEQCCEIYQSPFAGGGPLSESKMLQKFYISNLEYLIQNMVGEEQKQKEYMESMTTYILALGEKTTMRYKILTACGYIKEE